MTPFDVNAALEWALFLGLSTVAVAGAITMILTMSMYRAGLFLMISFIALAGLFFLLEAELLALIQIMMNVGGMLVMILFMVELMMDPGGEMMWDMKRQMKLPGLGALSMSMPRGKPPGTLDNPDGTHNSAAHAEAEMPKMSPAAHHKMMVDMAMSTEQLPWAIVAGFVTAVALAAVAVLTPWQERARADVGDAAAGVGELLLSRYMIAFEGAAMLILAGIAGAVILGRRENSDVAPEVVPADANALGGDGSPHTGETAMQEEQEKNDKGQWTCPMHPEVRADAPGRCPKCGMDLVQAEK